MLLSHDHHDDNLDDAGRALLPSARRRRHDRVRAPAGSAAARAGSSRGQSTRLEAPGKPAIDITATPCRHGPPLSHPIVGDVIGFALRWDGQEHGVLWISGDTVLYDGVREVADRLDVDTALLHLGGVQFPITGPLRYTMTGARRGRAVRPRAAAHGRSPSTTRAGRTSSEGRDGIEREFARAPDAVRRSLRWLPIGEPVEIEAPAGTPA